MYYENEAYLSKYQYYIILIVFCISCFPLSCFANNKILFTKAFFHYSLQCIIPYSKITCTGQVSLATGLYQSNIVTYCLIFIYKVSSKCIKKFFMIFQKLAVAQKFTNKYFNLRKLQRHFSKLEIIKARINSKPYLLVFSNFINSINKL